MIVIVEVSEGDMPVNPVLGDGQDLLQGLAGVPGAEELVEEGQSINDCIIDPEPEIPGDSASAFADPHIVSRSGAKFDLFDAGQTELLTIPEGASAEDAKLKITAVTEHMGPRE